MTECTDILFMPGGLGLCRGHVQWHALRPSGFLSWETVYLPPSSACIYSRFICISHLYWYLTFLTKRFIYTSVKMWQGWRLTWAQVASYHSLSWSCQSHAEVLETKIIWMCIRWAKLVFKNLDQTKNSLVYILDIKYVLKRNWRLRSGYAWRSLYVHDLCR